MRTLILLIVLLLAGVVDGSNSCFNDRCQSGNTEINLVTCGLTDEDIPDLVKCLEEVGRHNIRELYLEGNHLTTIPADLFQGLVLLELLLIGDNDLTTIPADLFQGLVLLELLNLSENYLTTLPEGVFNGLENLRFLALFHTKLTALPPGIFDGLGKVIDLYLDGNDLTTLPEGLFNDLGSLQTLRLRENNDLQCVPDIDPVVDVDVGLLGRCECTPAEAVMCDEGHDCAPGESGYTCEMAMHKLGGELHLSGVRSTDIV